MENKHAFEPIAVSVMAKLKQETQAIHTQTEQLSAMKRLFANDYSLEEYQQYLEKMYGYLSVMEPVLLQNLQDESLSHFFQARAKQALLMQDLLNFGLSQEQILALPKPPMPTYIQNLSYCLGTYYVLEGSSLGGQVIYKHLSQHFGESVADKLQFFHGYGELTRLKWQAFSELVNTCFPDVNQPEVTQIVIAANLTFAGLREFFAH